jgi:hypothetical protein
MRDFFSLGGEVRWGVFKLLDDLLFPKYAEVGVPQRSLIKRKKEIVTNGNYF